MLHGGGGKAEQEMQLLGLAQLSAAGRSARRVPGSGGRCLEHLSTGQANRAVTCNLFQRHSHLPDDVAFLRMLVADLVQAGISDPKRIYLAGRSLGGSMTLRMACVDAGSFAAIGLLIAAMPGAVGADCHPPMPVPVLMVNGTDDRVLPYKGERGRRSDILWSNQRLAAFFNHLNGCDESVEQSVLVPVPRQNIVVEHSTRCLGGPVVLYRIVGGGHDIPVSMNAGQVLLDFFRDKMR